MKNLENIRELLVVVDMVNGFVKSGALADPYIGHIIKPIEELIKEFKDSKDKDVIFIRDAHIPGCAEFKKFPEHCIDGTWESEIVDELKPYSLDSRIYKKNSRSTFTLQSFRNDLDKMRIKGILEKVIATGCCTDLCVLDLAVPLANYFDQMNDNREVIVLQDAVETYDAPWHNRDEYNDMAFKIMNQEGIRLVKTLGGKK